MCHEHVGKGRKGTIPCILSSILDGTKLGTHYISTIFYNKIVKNSLFQQIKDVYSLELRGIVFLSVNIKIIGVKN